MYLSTSIKRACIHNLFSTYFLFRNNQSQCLDARGIKQNNAVQACEI